ncbi:MAG TPA: phage tail protein [Chloroflexota bacterium]|nr:phage tail protein [Chloroflexota bacterium]
MAIVQALVRLTADNLRVEAGATVESIVEIGSSVEADEGSFQEYSLRVRGLPEGWYSLSSERVRVSAGSRVDVRFVIFPPYNDARTPLGDYPFAIEVMPELDGPLITLAGHVTALPPGALARQSRLLEYLPVVLRGDPFLARFLLIFQSIIDPIEQSINGTHHFLDPSLTPARFLPWLASWVDIEVTRDMDDATLRRLITRAVELARWKGTRRALRDEFRIRTGGRALIVENFEGMRLGHDAALGMNTDLGVQRDHFITVTLAPDGSAPIDQWHANELVQQLKPAYVGHVARVVDSPSRRTGGGRG